MKKTYEIYHEESPVLVDNLRLCNSRAVVVDDPVQMLNAGTSS